MNLPSVFKRGDKVLAAVSGGSDSVALLLMLNDMRLEGFIELYAAHLNHGIRGDESDGDERFVRELCQKLDVELFAERADVPLISETNREGLETSARRARWDFLFRLRDALKCDCIATAHHMDDQAETVLMHLFRGGGLKGAGGMAPSATGVVRPLLNCTKAELLEFLRKRGQDYREDSTNAFSDNPRNYLRHEVVPRVMAVYPAFAQALYRFSDIARVEDEYMSRAADEWMRSNVWVTSYGYIMSREGDEAILRRAVFAAVETDYEGVTRIIEAFKSSKAVEVPGWRIEIHRDGACFIRAGCAKVRDEVRMSDGARLEGVGRLRLTYPAKAEISQDPWSQTLDFDALNGAVLRTRRAGDVMRPFGMTGTRKLKDILIDRGIPRAHRDFTALLAVGSEIMWIPGVCISNAAKLTGETKRAVRLDWEREDMIPWKRRC